MRTDQQGQLIGAGEDTAYNIIKFAFNLESRLIREFPKPGIYRQMSIMKMLKDRIKKEIHFSDEFKKHTVDIVICTDKKQIIAVYVNGYDHNGSLKSSRDSTKYDYLAMSKITTIILRKSECPQLFKENHNYISILEVCNAFAISREVKV